MVIPRKLWITIFLRLSARCAGRMSPLSRPGTCPQPVDKSVGIAIAQTLSTTGQLTTHRPQHPGDGGQNGGSRPPAHAAAVHDVWTPGACPPIASCVHMPHPQLLHSHPDRKIQSLRAIGVVLHSVPSRYYDYEPFPILLIRPDSWGKQHRWRAPTIGTQDIVDGCWRPGLRRLRSVCADSSPAPGKVVVLHTRASSPEGRSVS